MINLWQRMALSTKTKRNYILDASAAHTMIFKMLIIIIVGVAAPECLPSPWSRDNHHGNNKDGFMNSYNWTIPEDWVEENCVIRLR